MAKKVSKLSMPVLIVLIYLVTCFSAQIYIGAWKFFGIDMLYLGSLFLVILIAAAIGYLLTKGTKNPNRKFGLLIVAIYAFHCCVLCYFPLWFITQWF